MEKKTLSLYVLLFLGVTFSCVVAALIFARSKNSQDAAVNNSIDAVAMGTGAATQRATITPYPTPNLTKTIVSEETDAAQATGTEGGLQTAEPTAKEETPDESLDGEPTVVEPTMTDQPADVLAQYGVRWYSDFEDTDLPEWNESTGEFLFQGSSGAIQLVSSPVKNGQIAAAMQIDTYNFDGSQAAYMFYYDTRDENYYSAWYYIPADTLVSNWWNIWQWKSTGNGDSDSSKPMWILDLTPGGTADTVNLALIYRPDKNNLKQVYTNPAALVPLGEWFHVAAYYKKSPETDGRVTIWLNGNQIFDVQNVHTTLDDNTLYWSVNHYTDGIYPAPAYLYVDDLIVSTVRIPPEFQLP